MIKTILIGSVAPATFFAVTAYLSALPIAARTISGGCAHHGWPYYQSACVSDARRAAGYAPEVRVVSADRLSVDGLVH